MPDNTKITQPKDRTEINIHQDYELTDWSKTLNVTKEQLKDAVKNVGPMLSDVKHWLDRN